MAVLDEFNKINDSFGLQVYEKKYDRIDGSSSAFLQIKLMHWVGNRLN
jgi:hypothetical protein